MPLVDAAAFVRISAIDSHTGGEPTRVVIDGFPELQGANVAVRREHFARDYDHLRRGIVCEPRGSDILVGALLQPPADPRSAAAVIFFNNVGYLGMCGHGAIGVIETLARLGRLTAGRHRLETPVGTVECELRNDGSVSIENVPSYRVAHGVTLDVPELGAVRGDVAWGGNMFFLVEERAFSLELSNVQTLTERALRIRQAVNAQGFPQVDHVELFASARDPGGNARNFVLCPGSAYDRSPCGTGTSAKLACLAAEGRLAPNTPWVQESITGSRFTASYEWLDREAGQIVPTITGRAHLTAETVLLFAPDD
jgi:4-hydroxyproline epimerase